LSISIYIKCWSDLEKYGVKDVLNQQYGSAVTSPESKYNFTIQVDLANPPSDKAAFARNVALLKRHALSAPFLRAFSDVEAKKAGASLIEVPYREDEAFYIKSEADRAIVIFSIAFKDKDDAVLAKVFLQEYQDARKTISNAPSVIFSQKEPPLELKGVRNLRAGSGNGFVSFVLFQPHILGKKKETTIDNIMTFRNYLHYHMKCSKAYLHTRMRNQVRSFLQVLNRSKSEQETKEKKTITGRTFTRADDAPATLSPEENI